MASLGTEIRAICNAVQARLNGHPGSAADWRTITRQLRSAADKARKVTRLAERMEVPNNPYRNVDTVIAVYSAGNLGDD